MEANHKSFPCYRCSDWVFSSVLHAVCEAWPGRAGVGAHKRGRGITDESQSHPERPQDRAVAANRHSISASASTNASIVSDWPYGIVESPMRR